MGVGCATTRQLGYDASTVARVRQRPVEAKLRVELFTDARRRDRASAQVLFYGEREAMVDGEKLCVNAEEHYETDRVPLQLRQVIIEHMTRRSVIREVSATAANADYVLTGRIASIYGEQDWSAAAAVGAQFGLLGALVTSGVTTKGRIDIRFVDLKLRGKDGSVKRLDDVRVEFKGELPADPYCWAIYDNVNLWLKNAVTRLAESVERVIRDSNSLLVVSQNKPPGTGVIMSASAIARLPQDLDSARLEKRRKADFERRRARWRAQHAAWQKENKQIKPLRETIKTSGLIIGGAGLGLIVVGAVFEGLAYARDDEAERRAVLWFEATEANNREKLASQIKEIKEQRDLFHTIGIGGLAVGAASLVTGVVMTLVAPSPSEEPEPPRRLTPEGEWALSLLPVLDVGRRGIRLSGRF